MSDFLIDLPYHKRWMLPDNIHYYNSVIYGDRIHVTIWNNRTGELKMSLPDIMLPIGDGVEQEKFRNLCELSQSLAEKKFCKPMSKAKAYTHTGDWRKR